MDTPSGPALIRALIGRQALSAEQTAWAMNEIMDGAATPAQIAGFGVALRAKGETAAEMSGLAASMLAHATPISIAGPVTDLVGTGGDGTHTVNVSTIAALYPPSLRHAGPVRSQLGVPTAFNYLGPLTNPARPSSLAVGVADPRMGPVLAGVYAERGVSALVFHGGGLG